MYNNSLRSRERRKVLFRLPRCGDMDKRRLRQEEIQEAFRPRGRDKDDPSRQEILDNPAHKVANAKTRRFNEYR